MSERVYALPIADGKLCMHFGHCQAFAIAKVSADGTIAEAQLLTPPPHQPGLLPRWLAEQGVTHVIAGGMGQRAQMIFQQCGIDVTTGALADTPQNIIKAHIAGNLECGDNVCDH